VLNAHHKESSEGFRLNQEMVPFVASTRKIPCTLLGECFLEGSPAGPAITSRLELIVIQSGKRCRDDGVGQAESGEAIILWTWPLANSVPKPRYSCGMAAEATLELALSTPRGSTARVT
jgi:hypothetical protein